MVVYMGTMGTSRARGTGEGGLCGCNEVVNYIGARDTMDNTGRMGSEGGGL